MEEVDRIMVENLKVPVELMMENAGVAMAELACEISSQKGFLVIAGKGNNGGGGIVAARRLTAWDEKVTIWLPFGKKQLRELPARQLERTEKFGAKVIEGVGNFPIEDYEGWMIIDAFIGYGYTGVPRGVVKDVFEFLSHHKTIISLDAPSGLDTTTGTMHSDFSPMKTLTLAFPKTGLLKARDKVGSLELADIGVPKYVFEKMIDIDWNSYEKDNLDLLYSKFKERRRVNVQIIDYNNWSLH